MDEEEVFNVEQAAAYLRVHKDTIRRAIKDGSLPAARLRGFRSQYRIRKSDLDALFRKRDDRK